MPQPIWLLHRRFQLIAGCVLLFMCILYFKPPLPAIQLPDHVFDKSPSSEVPAEVLSPADKHHDEICALRYTERYLQAFSQSAAEYCTPESSASLTCFSHHNSSDERVDSFCVGGPAIIDPAQKSVYLDCALRMFDEKDYAVERPRIDQFPMYMFETGPVVLFEDFIKLGREPSHDRTLAAAREGYSFLIKRENSNQNIWHTMMQIMALTMTLDILRITKNPATGKPFFTDADVARSQIIFLDNIEEGPYYDLWSMFCGMKPLRMNDASNEQLATTNILMPLPGGANPFWLDWVDVECGRSPLLKTYSDRVLNFYKIDDPKKKSKRPLMLTMIDRKEKRRLIGKEGYFEALKIKHPEVEMQFIDYAALTFVEQIQVTHKTDILVGVHGAGLAHEMFMPEGSTVVEILPPNLPHRGYKNMAHFLGHKHLSMHASEHTAKEGEGDWHDEDVFLEESRFMELLDEAVANAKAMHH